VRGAELAGECSWDTLVQQDAHSGGQGGPHLLEHADRGVTRDAGEVVQELLERSITQILEQTVDQDALAGNFTGSSSHGRLGQTVPAGHGD
jgi:hypothetical protein